LGLFRRGPDSPRRPLPDAAARLPPAEAGVVLAGGARPSHVAATLIDLSIRGHLGIEPCGSEGDPDFLVTRSAAPGEPGRDTLAGYERTLLRGLPRDPEHARLSQLKTTRKWIKAIGQFYHQLNREAILRGWARPELLEEMSPGDDPGARTRQQLRAFRQDLSRLTATGSDVQASLGDYLPYAVAFGLMPEWSGRFPESRPPKAGRTLPYPGGGLDQSSLAAVFASAACAHVQSIASQAGYGGTDGHHAGAHTHGHGGHAYGHDGDFGGGHAGHGGDFGGGHAGHSGEFGGGHHG
jgi:hypothetical protein